VMDLEEDYMQNLAHKYGNSIRKKKKLFRFYKSYHFFHFLYENFSSVTSCSGGAE
jgi:hypothetical protein